MKPRGSSKKRKRPTVECEVIEYERPSYTIDVTPAHLRIVEAISKLIKNGATYGRPLSAASVHANAIYFGDALKASDVATKVMFQDTNTTEGSIYKFLDNMVRGIHTGHLEDVTWQVYSVKPSSLRSRATFYVFKPADNLD